MVRVHDLYDYHSFDSVKVCVTTHDAVSYGECSVYTWKEWVFCYWWVFYWSNCLMVSFSSIPYDFLSTNSIDYWERSVEISKYNCGFTCFFCQLYPLLLHVFWSSNASRIYLVLLFPDVLTLLSWCNVSLFLVIFLASKFTLIII